MKSKSVALSSREFLTPDLSLIDFQKAQAAERGLVLSASSAYAGSRIAKTFFLGNKVVACIGISEKWSGVCVGWAIFDKNIGRIGMLGVVREVKKLMPDIMMMYHRVEISVVRDFSAGHRLADLLGFRIEGLQRKYDAFGRDHFLYSRTRDD